MQVRIMDLKDAVNRSLRKLPYHAYLAVMAVILGELDKLYRDRNSEEGQELVDRTLAHLRAAVAGYPAMDEVATRQAASDWLVLMGIPEEGYEDDDDIPLISLPVETGVVNLWSTFRDIAHELITDDARYSAVVYLTLAISGVDDPVLRGEESAEKAGPYADANSTTVVLLRKCQAAIELVGQKSASNAISLDEIRAVVFG